MRIHVNHKACQNGENLVERGSYIRGCLWLEPHLRGKKRMDLFIPHVYWCLQVVTLGFRTLQHICLTLCRRVIISYTFVDLVFALPVHSAPCVSHGPLWLGKTWRDTRTSSACPPVSCLCSDADRITFIIHFMETRFSPCSLSYAGGESSSFYNDFKCMKPFTSENRRHLLNSSDFLFEVSF